MDSGNITIPAKVRMLTVFSCLLILVSGCGIIKKSSKTDLVNDFYSQKISGEKKKVFVEIADETIRVYDAKIEGKRLMVDTMATCQFFPLMVKNEYRLQSDFVKHSFDVDFLTIPLKVRPSQKDVPAQINANLNGAGYFGYRTDKYSVKYDPDPLGIARRRIVHVGFSIGFFTGIGGTFMSPTNTNGQLQQEYDGIVWNKGIAGIFAVNNVTIGLAVGIDDLMDSNKNIWIYQQKPWFGLAFGLNLN